MLLKNCNERTLFRNIETFCCRKIIKFKKKILKYFGLDYRSLTKKHCDKPVEIYAFIRVKNEISTIEACLKSIEGIITKGVIGYNKLDNEIDDGTEEIILDFCKKNKGFKAIRYPYNVVPANSIEYKSLTTLPKEERLDTYYNEIFKHIPNNSWFMKIDCDHIFDREKLKGLAYLPKENNDIIILSRMNFHYKNSELYIINKNTIAANGEWLLLRKNENLMYTLKTGFHNDGTFFAWETLINKESNENIIKNRLCYYTDLFNWHFPFLKSSRNLDESLFTPFDNYNITEELKSKFHISEDMIDKEKILKMCKEFKTIYKK